MEEEFKLTKEQRENISKVVNRYMRIKFKRNIKKVLGINLITKSK